MSLCGVFRTCDAKHTGVFERGPANPKRTPTEFTRHVDI